LDHFLWQFDSRKHETMLRDQIFPTIRHVADKDFAEI